jgi:hypothetical protein
MVVSGVDDNEVRCRHHHAHTHTRHHHDTTTIITEGRRGQHCDIHRETKPARLALSK